MPVIEECVAGVRDAASRWHDEVPAARHFEEWVLRHLGSGMTRYFFRPYNEKVWNCPLDQLAADWATRLVPVPTLAEVLAGAEGKAPAGLGYNSVFYYPNRGGIGAIPAALLGSTSSAVHLRAEAVSVALDRREVRFHNGATARYRVLVSTLPLPALVRILQSVPTAIAEAAGRLRHVSVLNLNFVINRENVSDQHWTYFPDEDIALYRVGFPSNIGRELTQTKTSSLSVEITYRPGQPPDRAEIRDRVLHDLAKASILAPGDQLVTECPLELPYAYCLPGLTTRQDVETIRTYLAAHSIYSIGRFGSWDHLSIADVIAQARDLTTALQQS